MIDDTLLEDLISEVAESATEPDDGPARILAARDSLDRDRRSRPAKTGPRRVAIAGVIAVAAAVAIAIPILASSHDSAGTRAVARAHQPAPRGLHPVRLRPTRYLPCLRR
jgi:hypothetical protein